MPTINYNKSLVEGDLDLLLIGQDSYPQGANGIAFCKNTFQELHASNCCGHDVLKSIGLSNEDYLSKFQNPIELFTSLLINNRIGFINISETSKDEMSLEEIKIRVDLISKLIDNSNHTVCCGYWVYNTIVENNPFLKNQIMKVIHPSHYNKRKRFEIWADNWGSDKLINKLKLTKPKLH